MLTQRNGSSGHCRGRRQRPARRRRRHRGHAAGTIFAPEDRVFYDAIADKLTQRPDIQQAAAANSPENFGLILAKEFESGVLDQLGVAEDMALS